jgi:AraC-like DNA-binding protein
VTRTGVKPGVAADLLPHLRRAHDHIDRHYASAIDLAELARVAGVSKFHFARCFEAAYGLTPIRYLTRRRVERAQDLLRSANLTVTEICFLVGFSSLGSFSTRFTQLVGETPTAYRDRWAELGGPHVPGCYLFMHGPGRLGRAPAAGREQQVRNLREGPAGPPGLGSEP